MDLSGCDSSEWSGSVDLLILFLPLFLPSPRSFFYSLSPPLTPPSSLLPSPPSNRAMYQVFCRAPQERDQVLVCPACLQASPAEVSQSVSPLMS